MVYLNPGGFNFGPQNLDGYGISNIAFSVAYTICLLAGCVYLWSQRHHPIVKMRNVGLMLMSVLVIHLFCFMVFTVYTMNGAWPCSVEFWAMNLYLPIGIGLWQAQNQQLVIVSRQQTEMIASNNTYRPLLPKRGHGIGTPKYWIWRFKIWYQGISTQGKYEGAPSIVWQFLWNFFFGPYLLWRVCMIRDIYHWRLQTIIAVLAGLVPGMMAMEIVTLAFPIYQIIKHKRAARTTNRVLAEFDQKKLDESNSLDSMTRSSLAASSLKSKKSGKMYSMEALDACLAGNHDSLQIYASCMELNGENIIFLTKILSFRLLCQQAFHSTCNSSAAFRRARNEMFRHALSIFVTLIHAQTASYPINIESPIYQRLDVIFGPATALVACCKTPSRTSSFSTTTSSSVTPWDDPQEDSDVTTPAHSPMRSPTQEFPSFPMRTLSSKPRLSHKYSNTDGNGSSEHIVTIEDKVDLDGITSNSLSEPDPLEGVKVPAEFDENVFDAAFQSIRYMVWSETWQRFCAWKAKGNGARGGSIGRAI
ncbi:MAG: hypothetical protein Q9220_003625 [cf. Caloplaca sp. 1 TL-2023]